MKLRTPAKSKKSGSHELDTDCKDTKSSENVPYSTDRSDNFWFCGVRFYFAADTRNTQVNGPVKCFPPTIVGLFQELFAIEWTPLVSSKNFEKVEFHRSESDFIALRIKQTRAI